MSDTDSGVASFLRTALAQRTEGERLQMACGMFGTAVRLARAGILAESPGLTEVEVRVRVLRRLYASDLGEVALAAIEHRIRKGHAA